MVVRAIDSTNELARSAFEPGRERRQPRVVIAWEQTRGRGRRGNSWRSPAGGGIYASLAAPVADRAALECLPLLVPVSLCHSLAALGVRGCGLKWPNDLLVDGRKLGGILVEAVSRGGAPAGAVIGVGVNYRRLGPGGLDRPGAGVCDLLEAPPSLASFALRLVGPLLEELARLDAQHTEALIDSYRTLSVHRPGDRLICRIAEETVEGDFTGFDDSGFLCLRGAAGERRISTGEIVEH